jgi:hypothetical protein
MVSRQVGRLDDLRRKSLPAPVLQEAAELGVFVDSLLLQAIIAGLRF